MTDWLTYEWTYKEQRATFRVDMQYWNLLPVLSYMQLIAVSVSPLSPQAKKFSAREQYLFNLFRKKLVNKLSGPTIFRRQCVYGFPALYVFLYIRNGYYSGVFGPVSGTERIGGDLRPCLGRTLCHLLPFSVP